MVETTLLQGDSTLNSRLVDRFDRVPGFDGLVACVWPELIRCIPWHVMKAVFEFADIPRSGKFAFYQEFADHGAVNRHDHVVRRTPTS